MYQIVENKVIYNNLVFKKAKEFTYKEKNYIQFINIEQSKYILLEKIDINLCANIENKELKQEIIENNFEKSTEDIE